MEDTVTLVQEADTCLVLHPSHVSLLTWPGYKAISKLSVPTLVCDELTYQQGY